MDGFEPQALLSLLSQAGVDFVVIGGLGALLHGGSLTTGDLDIMYARDRPNLERLAEVLRDLGVRLRGAEDLPLSVDAQFLFNGDRFTFTSRLGALDCMATVDGAPVYSEVQHRAATVSLGDHSVRVAGIDDLIAMKRAANRLKDVPKLQELEELKRLDEDPS